MIFGREPAVIIGLVETVLALGIAFGLDLSGEQVGAIMAVTTAVLAVVIRQVVTPVAALKELDKLTPAQLEELKAL